MRSRLAELPDGEWQAREYVDMPGGSCTVAVTAIKKGDELTYDFTGSSPQVDLGINCCYWATWGGMFAPIFPLLAWDVTWNEGVTRPVSLIAPEGTVVNCIRPAPISIATVGTIQIVNNLSTILLSKMLATSPRYRDRATAVWHGSHAHLETHGLDETGEFYIAPLTDTFCGAAGARALADGVDLGGEIPNVVSRWGQRREPGAQHTARVPLSARRSRLGRTREVPRRGLPRVRLLAKPNRRSHDGLDAVRGRGRERR